MIYTFCYIIIEFHEKEFEEIFKSCFIKNNKKEL